MNNFCYFLVKPDFVYAVANFEQKNGGVYLGLKTDISGLLQQNGDFIFHYDGDNKRKLVQTTNEGAIIKSGYVDLPNTEWADPNGWKKYAYRVTNFRGIEGAIPILMNHIRTSSWSVVNSTKWNTYYNKRI